MAVGILVVLIVRVAGVTGREIATEAVCIGFAASVAFAVKLKLPATVGVPEIMPVDEARVSPAGRLPEAIDQV